MSDVRFCPYDMAALERIYTTDNLVRTFRCTYCERVWSIELKGELHRE